MCAVREGMYAQLLGSGCAFSMQRALSAAESLSIKALQVLLAHLPSRSPAKLAGDCIVRLVVEKLSRSAGVPSNHGLVIRTLQVRILTGGAEKSES